MKSFNTCCDIDKVQNIMRESKRENHDTLRYIEENLVKTNKNLRNIGTAVSNVDSSFRELRGFKGRFLKHIYDDQKLTEDVYKQEKKDAILEFKHAAPLNVYQQRQATKRRKMERIAERKKVDQIQEDPRVKRMAPTITRHFNIVKS